MEFSLRKSFFTSRKPITLQFNFASFVQRKSCLHCRITLTYFTINSLAQPRVQRLNNFGEGAGKNQMVVMEKVMASQLIFSMG